MYTTIYRSSRFLKRLAKLTAFSAAFLLLIQPLGVLIVHAEEESTASTNTQISSTEKKTIKDSVITHIDASAIPEFVQEAKSKKTGEPQGPQFLTGNGTSKTITPSEKTKQLLETDPTSGALVYAYDIALPPGRNSLSPNISLQYNSNAKNNDTISGYGWEFDIPSITRLNKYGSEQLYDHSNFSSSLSGELVNISGTSYGAKVEDGDFLSYTFSNNTWTVYGKDGTRYLFGQSTETRQDDPNDSSRIYKWMLEEVRDTNDNYIRYEYYKDEGQIYPSRVLYTGHGSEDGIFEVNFSRESLGVSPKFYSTGFEVKVNYQIVSIEIEENNQWVKKYQLAYVISDSADGNIGTRKLLSSITESGRDLDTDIITTLDPTIFTYKQSAIPQWTMTEDNKWELPKAILNASHEDYSLIQIRDVNGDAYPDVLFSKNDDYPCAEKKNVWLNDHHGGWEAHPGCGGHWEIPIFLKDEDNYYHDYGTRAFDYNGDLITDLVWAYDEDDNGRNSIDEWEVWKGIGTSLGWTSIPTVDVPNSFVYAEGGHADSGVQIVDVNQDGLQDIIYSFEDQGIGLEGQTYLGNGAGWDASSSGEWMPPHAHITQVGSLDDLFTYAQYVDINGDGLPDVLWSDDEYPNPKETTYINNGHGWLEDVPGYWEIPAPFQGIEKQYYGASDAGSRMVDINGDGLMDIVNSYYIEPTLEVINSRLYLNTLDPINPFIPFEISVPEGFVNEFYIPWYSVIVDINADGMDDIVYSAEGTGEDDSSRTHLLNNTPFTDLLVSIETPNGATSEITYKSSTQYFDTAGTLLNPKLPFLVTTVAEITTTDGFGTASTDSFTYTDGQHYFNTPRDKKFAGFGLVTTTDSVGNLTKTYFHQGNDSQGVLGEYDDHIAKMGKPYRIETYDASGNLYQLTINKWDQYNIGTDHDFVKLARETVLTYDGDSDHKDTASEYTYDNANGNLLSEINYGEVVANTDGSFTDSGSDKGTTTYTYATNSTGQFALSQQTLVNNADNKVTDTKYFYDGQPFGTVTLGNVTKTRNWKTGSQWADTLTSYNSYGLPTSTTDPRGKVTQYIYDTYNLYPATITNPLLHVTQYLYDYSSGKPIQVTDPNNLVTQTVLDGLDRVLEEKIPDLTTPSTLVTKAMYAYTDTAGAVSVHKTNHLDASTTVDSYQYFDGLGRMIQERTEAEASNTFNVTDTLYNTRGLLEKESLPYASTGSTRTPVTTDSTLYTTNMYDPLARPIAVSTTLGTTSYAYDQWKTTITDANTKQKILTSDAYQNLIQVEEKNAGATYTTTYKWNLAKRLTKLTDALGNIRNFTYDGLGRRLTAEDLHAPADATFGTWIYTYDDAGNLTQSVDPKAQTINYTYDSLNRTLTEKYTGTTGTDITYTYDTGTYGKGHLASATVAGSVASAYTYNPNGAVASEAKTISSTTYTTSYTYDRQGNMLTLTYPDLSQVKYLYSTAGYLNKIRRKENGGSFTDVVTSFSYTPTGNVKVTNFANGVSTTNTYDATKLYRLTNKKTNLGSTKYQNLSYTYDSVGNIMQIVDASNTNTAKILTFTYDDLYRLLSATATGTVAGGNFTETYTYNELGNILSKSDLGTYAYTGNTGTNYANPHAVTTIAGITRTYDPNGNLLTDGTNTYTWNYKNQLASAVTPTGTLTYTYDHTGARQTYTTPSTTTITPTNAYEVEGTIKRRHVYAGDTLLATIEKDASTTTPFYSHADHLGSVEKMTNQAGIVTELNDFYPFGKVRYNEGNTAGDKTFLGKYHDVESGFEYLEARYYGSKFGQFTSQDPAFLDIGGAGFKEKYERTLAQYLRNPQALNSYSYAHNNPITLSDPDGEIVSLAILGALAFYGGYSAGTDLYEGYTNGDNGQFAWGLVGAGLSLVPGGSAAKGAASLTDDAARGATNLSKNFFRGGEIKFDPGDFRETLTNGKINPSKAVEGISVNLSQEWVAGKGNGISAQIKSLPKGLQITQQGKNLNHYVIRPTREMAVKEFKALINKMNSRLKSINSR